MKSDIGIETKDHVAILRIERPDAMNALNTAALRDVAEAAARLGADKDVRCLLIAGSERAFCSGADVAELADASMVELYHRNLYDTWRALWQVRKPLVAAASGYAMGVGFELLLACDIVVASETLRLGMPEVAMGTIPGGGGTQRLTHVLGPARAMDIILAGRTLTAREAFSMGLVSRVVPREHFYEQARAVCAELVRRPPLALELAKEAIRQAHEMPLSAGLAYERNLQYLVTATADRREGMHAFLEKRPAVFVGR